MQFKENKLAEHAQLRRQRAGKAVDAEVELSRFATRAIEPKPRRRAAVHVAHPSIVPSPARAVCRRVERTQSVARRAAHVAVVRQCRASSEHAVRRVRTEEEET